MTPQGTGMQRPILLMGSWVSKPRATMHRRLYTPIPNPRLCPSTTPSLSNSPLSPQPIPCQAALHPAIASLPAPHAKTPTCLGLPASQTVGTSKRRRASLRLPPGSMSRKDGRRWPRIGAPRFRTLPPCEASVCPRIAAAPLSSTGAAHWAGPQCSPAFSPPVRAPLTPLLRRGGKWAVGP
jgi:hypothetical protein